LFRAATVEAVTDVLHRIAQSVEASSSLCGHCIFDEKGSRDHSRDGADCGPVIVPLAGSSRDAEVAFG